jgi:hypothetical protein
MTRFLPLALVAALVAAGCGSGGSTENTAPGGAETTESTAPGGAETTEGAAPGGAETTEGATPGGAETAEAHQSGAEGPTGITARPCRNTGEEGLLMRVTGVSCSTGKKVAASWRSKSGCAPAAGESRSACTVGGFRCLTVSVGQGLAVTCARPERSIAFIVKG